MRSWSVRRRIFDLGGGTDLKRAHEGPHQVVITQRLNRHAALAAPILLALAFACLFARGRSGGAADTAAAQQPVQVLEVVPHEVEVGDHIAILGDGFPPGKHARVAFRGTLHRPGERPARSAEIVVLAAVVAPGRIEFSFDDATQALFCGAGDRAIHTTFEGDVEVGFPAAVRGAAPLVGLLEHAIVDVRPSASASQRQREREGERVLAWIGVQAVQAAHGLVVDGVKPASRAWAAGIMAGDVVASFDGVRVASFADVLPPPGERAATIAVRSARATSETMHIVAMDGFRRRPPAELLGAALIVFAALAVVWLFGAPNRPTVAAVVQRFVSRMRRRIGVARFAPLRAVARAALPPYGATAIPDVAACAMLATMPFGQYVVAARLDVGLLFVAAATSLAGAAFVARRSVWHGLRAFVHVAWQHTPAAAAVASVVLTTGSLRIQEIERAQTGYPWDWLAFRSPAGLAAFGLLLACLLIEPEADGVSGLGALLEDDGNDNPTARAAWLQAACRAHRVIVAGLASALFLGGWLLPGLGAAQQEAQPALELAGAACLLAKTWALVLLMACARWALPRWRMAQRTRATALWIAPLAMAVLAATAAWTWWSPSPATQLLVSTSLVAAVGLGAATLTHRVRHGLTSAGSDGHLSPFL
jgi:NADH-quinone oxidoreductase subunit H